MTSPTDNMIAITIKFLNTMVKGVSNIDIVTIVYRNTVCVIELAFSRAIVPPIGDERPIASKLLYPIKVRNIHIAA